MSYDIVTPETNQVVILPIKPNSPGHIIRKPYDELSDHVIEEETFFIVDSNVIPIHSYNFLLLAHDDDYQRKQITFSISI